MGDAEIRSRIPHAGSMSLLDAIVACDDKTITARASSHRDPANPLRSTVGLHAVCGVEYAAQAMAVHAGVNEPDKGRPAGGFLASVRDLRLSVERIDTLTGDLLIVAERLGSTDDSFMYAFRILADDAQIISGRVAVKLMGETPA